MTNSSDRTVEHINRLNGAPLAIRQSFNGSLADLPNLFADSSHRYRELHLRTMDCRVSCPRGLLQLSQIHFLKNYLEYVYRHPRFMATCVYAMYGLLIVSHLLRYLLSFLTGH